MEVFVSMVLRGKSIAGVPIHW